MYFINCFVFFGQDENTLTSWKATGPFEVVIYPWMLAKPPKYPRAQYSSTFFQLILVYYFCAPKYEGDVDLAVDSSLCNSCESERMKSVFAVLESKC